MAKDSGLKGYFQIVMGLLIMVLVLLAGTFWTSWGWALWILFKGSVLAVIGLIGLGLVVLGAFEVRETS